MNLKLVLNCALIAAFGLCSCRPQLPAMEVETNPVSSTLAAASPAALTSSPTPAPTQTKPSTTLPAVLSAQQALQLHEGAQQYLAEDEPSAIKVARSLNFLGINSHPSNMCGPLAIAILRDAGLLDADLDLDDFFYFNPRPGIGDRLVDSTFPNSLYQKIEINEPINTANFKETPLMAGDFLYLFSGKSGNFDHVITVDYVDETGRAYAVTNLNTPNGYVIKEVMLYDPSAPGVGQFYEWTDRKNSKLGLTGFGGIWIWRLLKTPAVPEPQTEQFQRQVNTQKESAGGEWHIYIQELGKDPLYSSLAYQIIHPASTIKIADAVLFFKALATIQDGDVKEYISTHGTSGRTFEQLLHAMLVNSEEAAMTALEKWTEQYLNPNETLHDLGFEHTYINPRQSTAEEMAHLLTSLVQGELVDRAAQQIILDYLAEPAPNDNTLIGVIRPNLKAGDILYSDRRGIAYPQLEVADLALLVAGGKTYVISIFAYHDNETNRGTFEDLQSATETISTLFFELIQSK